MKRLLLWLLGAYKRWISPALPQRCKYYPSCSSYAVEAVAELGPLRGSIVAGWRLLRCNPLSDGGIDDLADRKLFRDHDCHARAQGCQGDRARTRRRGREAEQPAVYAPEELAVHARKEMRAS